MGVMIPTLIRLELIKIRLIRNNLIENTSKIIAYVFELVKMLLILNLLYFQVDCEDEGFSYNKPSVLEDYLKLGIKR